MLRRTFCWSVAFVLIASVAYGQERYVRIEKPRDGQTVEGLPDVEGKVSDPKAKVILVVCRWDEGVPGPATRRCEQRREILLQRPHWTDGRGRRDAFQIRAVANPRRELREGQVLSAWLVRSSSSGNRYCSES